MTVITTNTAEGAKRPGDLVYAEQPLGTQNVSLTTRLFMPEPGGRPAPVLIWLGAAVLTERTANPQGPERLAGYLNRQGVALAEPTLRTNAGPRDIPAHAVERLSVIEPRRETDVDPVLSSFAGIGATADVCSLLAWLDQNADAMGLSGQIVLAGASIGASLAFNVAVMAPHLGLFRPDPVGLLSYSGTCAWPSLYAPSRMSVFALNNPIDPQTPVGPVRAMARRDPRFEIIESLEQTHGSLGLWPKESSQEACGRILDRIQRWCAT